MPEVNIGLAPDAGETARAVVFKPGRSLVSPLSCAHVLVGAMHFLRTACAPSLGLYFALTGKRLGSADVMYAGLATHLAAGASSSAPLVRALAAARPQDWAATLDACGASTATSDPSELASLRAAIDEACLPAAEEAKENNRPRKNRRLR